MTHPEGSSPQCVLPRLPLSGGCQSLGQPRPDDGFNGITFVKTLQTQPPLSAGGEDSSIEIWGQFSPHPAGSSSSSAQEALASPALSHRCPFSLLLSLTRPQPSADPVLPGVRRPGAHGQEARPVQELPEAGVRGLAQETVSASPDLGSCVGAGCSLRCCWQPPRRKSSPAILHTGEARFGEVELSCSRSQLMRDGARV